MENLFGTLTNRHKIFIEESNKLAKEELLAKARDLLKEIRESGAVIVDPEQRDILSSLAHDLGEKIFDISGRYPSMRLARPISDAGDKLDRAAAHAILPKQSAEMASLGTQLLELTRHWPDIHKQIVSFLDSPNVSLDQEKAEKIRNFLEIKIVLPERSAKVESEKTSKLAKETFYLPFTDREMEKQFIRKQLDADFCVQIHAPSGLGKTYLMKEVQSQLREEGWQTIWIGFKQRHRDCIANRYRFLQAFSEQLDGVTHVGSFSETSSLEKIGLVLADNLNPVVLFIDDADQAAPSLLRWIRETFLHTLTTDWQVPIRIVAAGQQLIPEWQYLGRKGKTFHKISLSHFDDPLVIEQIINHVVARFGARRVQEKMAKNNEAWQADLEIMVNGLLSISCGHPLVMAEVLGYAAERNGFMQATFFTKNWRELCERCLAPIVDGHILLTVDRVTREAFRSLCIFRYVWPELIRTLTDAPDELADPWEPFSTGRKRWFNWWSRLEDTPLIIYDASRCQMFPISPVIRQVIAKVLQAEDESLYRTRNRYARQQYEQLLMFQAKATPPSQRVAFLLEVFYHATQDGTLSRTEAVTVFKQKLNDFLHDLATDESSLNVASQLKLWLREDTELQQAINQLAGPELYDQLIEMVEHFLKGEKEDNDE